MKNKNFWKYYEELSDWMENNDYNGNIEFAFNNGFDVHAVQLWIGSGASSLDLPCPRYSREERAEIRALLKYADIFRCNHCNHHSYFCPGEIDSDEITCESCGKIMQIESRGK